LREAEAQLAQRDVSVAVVTFENDFFARQYVAETGLDWPLLIDAQREVYRAYGMLAASWWDIWGPATWVAYLRELGKGHLPKKPSSDDFYQRGGDVLIDPDGVVRLHHVGAGPADRPAVTALLELISPA
jgi:alkyl hydroperoxide reductase subunit AhpC